MKDMKRIARILTMLAAALLLTACSNIGKIEVLGFRIKSVSAESLLSVKGTISLNMANYGPKLKFLSTEGTLYRGDIPIGTINADDFEVEGHGSNWVDVGVRIRLEEHVSLLQFLAKAKINRMDDYNITVNTHVKLGPAGAKITKEHISIAGFLKK